MKFDFNGDEMSVLLMSLIQRRTNVLGLLERVQSESCILSYRAELHTVENLLEKFFPGSVANLKKNAA